MLPNSSSHPIRNFYRMEISMEFRQCASCRKQFQRKPQVREQRFCSAPECQRKRRQLWQKRKLKTDPAYKKNQSWAQKEWAKRNPRYAKEYNRRNHTRLERNRELQQARNHKRRGKLIAKMDPSSTTSHLAAGIYRLIPVDTGSKKMDPCTVEIRILSVT